jgi:hypothetical protein
MIQNNYLEIDKTTSTLKSVDQIVRQLFDCFIMDLIQKEKKRKARKVISTIKKN